MTPPSAPSAPAAPNAANTPGPAWNVMRARRGATTGLFNEIVPMTAIASNGKRTSGVRIT